MTLFPLINQQTNLDFLTNAIKHDRVSNAYIFYGPEGSGTEGFALEFAAMLNCQSGTPTPCGTCSACKKIRRLEHSNLELVYPIPRPKDSTADDEPFKKFTQAQFDEIQELIRNKAQNPYFKIKVPKALHIPINFIREIKRRTYLRSQESGWKVIVIFDAHLMTEPAANAFLKILEEPPEKSTFILSTSNLSAMLPTIVSRCQTRYFPALSLDQLRDYLIQHGAAENHINLIIRLSAGDIQQALCLINTEIDQFVSLILDIMRSVAGWNIKNIYNLVESLAAIQREDEIRFKQILMAIAFWFRDAIVLKTQSDPQQMIYTGLQTEIANFVRAYPDFDPFFALTSVENCIDFIRRNAYINLALLHLFFNLSKSLKPGKQP